MSPGRERPPDEETPRGGSRGAEGTTEETPDYPSSKDQTQERDPLEQWYSLRPKFAKPNRVPAWRRRR